MLLGTAITRAQQNDTACGPETTRFQIRASKSARPDAPPAGKALVYLIEDNTDFNWTPEPTTRVAIDGNWKSAVHGNAATAFEVAPGAHRLCLRWQDWSRGGAGLLRGLRIGYTPASATVALEAETGKIYYYLAHNLYDPHGGAAGAAHIELTPLPAAEGGARASFPSTSPGSPPQRHSADSSKRSKTIRDDLFRQEVHKQAAT